MKQVVHPGHGLSIYPVGAVYMSLDETSPAALFGGDWAKIEGRFLLAADSSHAAKSTGGAASHNASAHTMQESELPSLAIVGYGTSTTPYTSGYYATRTAGSVTNAWIATAIDEPRNASLKPKQTSHAHTVETMPPYIAVHMWRRTA